MSETLGIGLRWLWVHHCDHSCALTQMYYTYAESHFDCQVVGHEDHGSALGLWECTWILDLCTVMSMLSSLWPPLLMSLSLYISQEGLQRDSNTPLWALLWTESFIVIVLKLTLVVKLKHFCIRLLATIASFDLTVVGSTDITWHML